MKRGLGSWLCYVLYPPNHSTDYYTSKPSLSGSLSMWFLASTFGLFYSTSLAILFLLIWSLIGLGFFPKPFWSPSNMIIILAPIINKNCTKALHVWFVYKCTRHLYNNGVYTKYLDCSTVSLLSTPIWIAGRVTWHSCMPYQPQGHYLHFKILKRHYNQTSHFLSLTRGQWLSFIWPIEKVLKGGQTIYLVSLHIMLYG